MPKQLVVVIAGVTCGGKTTISNNLTNIFDNTSILHQDDFYHSNYKNVESIPELNYNHWDKINAYDMDKMMTSINTQSCNILVLEGILLLDDIRILNLAHIIFFLVLNKDECFERRKARTYLPPEPDGYFDKYAWPEYERHLAMVKKEKREIVFLNGLDSIDFNMTIVVNHINQKLFKLKH